MATLRPVPCRHCCQQPTGLVQALCSRHDIYSFGGHIPGCSLLVRQLAEVPPEALGTNTTWRHSGVMAAETGSSSKVRATRQGP